MSLEACVSHSFLGIAKALLELWRTSLQNDFCFDMVTEVLVPLVLPTATPPTFPQWPYMQPGTAIPNIAFQ